MTAFSQQVTGLLIESPYVYCRLPTSLSVTKVLQS